MRKPSSGDRPRKPGSNASSPSTRTVAKKASNNKTKPGRKRNPTKASGPAQGTSSGPPGFAARELALHLLHQVLAKGHAFDDVRGQAFEGPLATGLSMPDKGLARQIVATVLRQLPALEAVVDEFLRSPLPGRQRQVHMILVAATAQLLVLKTPPHAAISLAVEQARRDRLGTHLSGLVNAVLRRVATEGPAKLKSLDSVRLAIPNWLWNRWVKTYGSKTAYDIAAASLKEAPLDLSINGDRHAWAARLEGTTLLTGSVRRKAGGRIEQIEGYGEGTWWVQDAAAALPAQLLGDINGADVLDLCAAPGGKTAQLAAAGASVTALDIDATRLQRVKQNLDRLHLTADLVVADATTWQPGRKFDAVLLDAPCTATGTIRRHPDILHLKRDSDVDALARTQAQLLKAAFQWLRPGGHLIFCTCSLEPEEGEQQIETFLKTTPEASLVPIRPSEVGIDADWLTPTGMLRTLPFHDPRPLTERSSSLHPPGMDAFFAARLTRNM